MTAPYYADDLVTLHYGDCLGVLPSLPDASIDSVVTDPPYALEFMGREWDRFTPAAFQSWCEAWARECLRVLKPGGYLLAFGGTRTYHRLACGIEDAGFEVRDSLHWLYGSGFPKGKACLKPSHEPIVMARKPALRSAPLPGLDGCRVDGVKDVPASPRRAAQGSAYGELGNDPGTGSGWDRNVGRWPPNVLLTHSAECQPAGIRKVHGTKPPSSRGGQRAMAFGMGQQGKADMPFYTDADGMETVEAWDCAPGCPVAELDAQAPAVGSFLPTGRDYDGGMSGDIYGARTYHPTRAHDAPGGASRFFPVFRYQAKASKAERPRLPDGTAHPTVKPVALMRWLVRLVTPPGGMILDPFAGSGTTLQAAALEGFHAIGIEADGKHLVLAALRLSQGVLAAS